jgi:hypothetical protein
VPFLVGAYVHALDPARRYELQAFLIDLEATPPGAGQCGFEPVIMAAREFPAADEELVWRTLPRPRAPARLRHGLLRRATQIASWGQRCDHSAVT